MGLEGSALMGVLILVNRTGLWRSGVLYALIGVCATGGVFSLFIVCAVQAKIPLSDRYAKREEFHLNYEAMEISYRHAVLIVNVKTSI